MRWMHIASMALLVGGAAFLKLIVAPGIARSAEQEALASRFAAGLKPLVFAAIVGILGSGIFNFFARPGHTKYYHMLFGIKMLLVAHVFASALLMVKSGVSEKHFFRRATGVFVSGVAVILISAYLRRIF